MDRQRRDIAKLKGGHRWRKHEPFSGARRNREYGKRHGSRGDRKEMLGERSRSENDGRDRRKRVEKRSSGDAGLGRSEASLGSIRAALDGFASQLSPVAIPTLSLTP
ncbi:hypothetical protein M9H77_06902 [Catharanthus roseus]|uniref:Uncharacterized protein n=1 Tax=Catharanthus roseus TaxID=4058 RepID=A0ACC0BTE8_CATRO|nr:hypothetical protein M9H77_06902 [Catharanthus roseus]